MDDLWDDDEPVQSPPPRRSRRWRRLFVLGVMMVALWQLPQVTLVPASRDWPLQQAFPGIAGRLSSSGADWHWLGPIVYRNVLLETGDGQPLLAVDRLTIGRSPFLLAVRPTDLGRIVLQGGRLSTAVWQGGSTVETVLEPWLARLAETPTAPPPTPAVGRWGGGAGDQPAAQPSEVKGSLELIDFTVELIDLRHDDAWWITDLAATVPLSAAAATTGLPPIDTVLSGRLQHVGRVDRALRAARTDHGEHSRHPLRGRYHDLHRARFGRCHKLHLDGAERRPARLGRKQPDQPMFGHSRERSRLHDRHRKQ